MGSSRDSSTPAPTRPRPRPAFPSTRQAGGFPARQRFRLGGDQRVRGGDGRVGWRRTRRLPRTSSAASATGSGAAVFPAAAGSVLQTRLRLRRAGAGAAAAGTRRCRRAGHERLVQLAEEVVRQLVVRPLRGGRGKSVVQGGAGGSDRRRLPGADPRFGGGVSIGRGRGLSGQRLRQVRVRHQRQLRGNVVARVVLVKQRVKIIRNGRGHGLRFGGRLLGSRRSPSTCLASPACASACSASAGTVADNSGDAPPTRAPCRKRLRRKRLPGRQPRRRSQARPRCPRRPRLRGRAPGRRRTTGGAGAPARLWCDRTSRIASSCRHRPWRRVPVRSAAGLPRRAAGASETGRGGGSGGASAALVHEIEPGSSCAGAAPSTRTPAAGRRRRGQFPAAAVRSVRTRQPARFRGGGMMTVPSSVDVAAAARLPPLRGSRRLRRSRRLRLQHQPKQLQLRAASDSGPAGGSGCSEMSGESAGTLRGGSGGVQCGSVPGPADDSADRSRSRSTAWRRRARLACLRGRQVVRGRWRRLAASSANGIRRSSSSSAKAPQAAARFAGRRFGSGANGAAGGALP